MALPENSPRANLTPEQKRQRIRRLKQRMADAQALNEMDLFDPATREYNLGYQLHGRVRVALSVLFGNGTCPGGPTLLELTSD